MIAIVLAQPTGATSHGLPEGSWVGSDPRQIAAAEGLRQWAATGGPDRASREETFELTNGQHVHVVPERTGAARCEVTWRELAADPLGTLTHARILLEAVNVFDGRILPAQGLKSEATLKGRGVQSVKPSPWGPVQEHVERILTLTPADLPESLRLDGHRTVASPATWLQSVRADVARGPAGPRARNGALQGDLATLFEAIGGQS